VVIELNLVYERKFVYVYSLSYMMKNNMMEDMMRWKKKHVPYLFHDDTAFHKVNYTTASYDEQIAGCLA